jgi:hypothetical protein
MIREYHSERFSSVAVRLALATGVGLALTLAVGLSMSASQTLAAPASATGVSLPEDGKSALSEQLKNRVLNHPSENTDATRASPAGSSLSTSPDWTLEGQDDGDRFGYSVARAGDVNGDGYADVIVGAYGVSSPTNRGAAYVYLGHGNAIATTPAFTLADPGQSDGDRFGYSVARAGDVNGDGYGDLIVGAYGVPGGKSAGAAYVYLGSGNAIATTPAFTLADPRQTSGDLFGCSVAGAGDVNGDGYADLIVGAYGTPESAFRGAAYVYLGSGSTLTATPALTLTGHADWDYYGYSVAGAGDLNGDGYADLIVGAFGVPGSDSRGEAYVYLGSGSTIASSPAFTLTGQADDDYFGRSVAGAGDVNGDGYADLVVGAWGVPGGGDRGAAYVYLGGGATIATTPAFTLTGQANHDAFGVSVAGAGDVNGDGYADLVVGARGVEGGTRQGAAYVYLGGGSTIATTPAFTLSGQTSGDDFGFSVAGAGDVDGDGYADLVVGAYGTPGGDDRGAAYVYLGGGGAIGSTPSFILSDPNQINHDSFGISVAGAGDVNGDGYGDLVVGATGVPSNTHQGAAYVYLGSESGIGTTPAFTLTDPGQADGDHFGVSVAGAGDINGDGYGDLIIGADGTPGGGADQGAAYIYLGSGSGISNTPAFTLSDPGQANYDYFGYSVAGAGDVNGDGCADLVVGAHGVPGPTGRGAAYVYLGSGSSISSTPAFTLSDPGQVSWDFFGISVAGAGDVNGDGYADLVVGASGTPGVGAFRGAAYVYLGGRSGIGSTPTVTLTDPDQVNEDDFGYSVAGAGDVNGDGYADLVIGAYGVPGGADHGAAYVYLGSGGIITSTPAYTLTDPGQITDDFFGAAVAGVGDLNGDGYSDIAIGASGTPGDGANTGAAYVYLGSGSGVSNTPAVTLSDPPQFIRDNFGHSLAGAGDVNGDGYADLIVGAHGTLGGGMRGAAYVYLGNGAGGRPVLARQVRGDGSTTPVEPWGRSLSPNTFEVHLNGTDPWGRGRVKLQVQACPPGVPFGHASCRATTQAGWTDVTTAATGVTLVQTVTVPRGSTLYRWRARVLYAPLHVTEPGITPPPNPAHGPWRRLQGQAVEADIRVDPYRVRLPLVLRNY